MTGKLPLYLVLILLAMAFVRTAIPKSDKEPPAKRSMIGRAPGGNWSGRILIDAVGGKIRRELVLGARHSMKVYLPSANSLLIFGPTRSGKTSRLAAPLLQEFEGPAIVTSVKRDLLLQSLSAREKRGQAYVFDLSGGDTCTWNIFSLIENFSSAKEVSDALCRVNRGLTGELDFWSQLASKMLAPLLLAAKEERLRLSAVLRWIEAQDFDYVFEVLNDHSHHEAQGALEAVVQLDQRTVSSVIATLLFLLGPLGASTAGDLLSTDGLDLSKILDRSQSNTLYILSPLFKAERFYCIYEVFIRKILELTYASPVQEPKVLFLFDELANVAPIGDLDKVASTCGGFGIVLVSVFQDLSQLDAAYGIKAKTVVNNHRSKMFLSGISDFATIEYVNAISSDARKIAKDRIGLSDIRMGEALLMNSGRAPATIRLRSPRVPSRVRHLSRCVRRRHS